MTDAWISGRLKVCAPNRLGSPASAPFVFSPTRGKEPYRCGWKNSSWRCSVQRWRICSSGPRSGMRRRSSEPESSGFVGDLEVRVGSLAVGFDPDGAGFSLEAADFTSALGLSSIVLNARRDQFTSLEHEISEIVSQSRPRCPLCGQPLSADPHFCPESNGHARVGDA